MSGFFWFGGAPEAQLLAGGSPQDLTPTLYTDADTFYSATVTTPSIWDFVAVGTASTVASGDVTCIEPSGAAEGDLLVACIAYRDSVAFTLPTGWSLVATQQSSGDIDAFNGIASGVMAYIVRGASAPDYVFTRTGGNVAIGRVVAYRGNTSAPYDTGSANTLAAESTTATTGTITTAEANELLVAMCAEGDAFGGDFVSFTAATDPAIASGATDTTTSPTAGTWIERCDDFSVTGADTALGVADAVKATAGATGTLQVTVAISSRAVMIAGAFKMQIASAQDLTPALFTDADTFYTPVVTTDYGLTPGLFTDADTFYTHALTGLYELIPGLFTDADTFYSPTVALDGATQDLTPGLYVDGDTFYSATVAASYSLLPAYYDDPDLFHAPAVTGAYELTPALYADADTFYSEIVAQAGGPQFILPPYYDDPDIFHAALVAESQSVTQASRFDDPDEFYAAHVSRVGRGGVTRFRPLAYG